MSSNKIETERHNERTEDISATPLNLKVQGITVVKETPEGVAKKCKFNFYV